MYVLFVSVSLTVSVHRPGSRFRQTQTTILQSTMLQCYVATQTVPIESFCTHHSKTLALQYMQHAVTEHTSRPMLLFAYLAKRCNRILSLMSRRSNPPNLE